MSDLRDLYQQVILDHYRRPRNFREEMGEAHCHADGFNPLCGDRVTVYVQVDEGRITDVAFQGSGCAISTASTSLLTDAVKGRTVKETAELFGDFHALVTGAADPDDLGKLAIFGGVREFPARVKCATLGWHTLKAALDGAEQPVTTE